MRGNINRTTKCEREFFRGWKLVREYFGFTDRGMKIAGLLEGFDEKIELS